MRTLADLKRAVATPNTTLTLVASLAPKTGEVGHKYLNLTRRVAKAQTNAVALLDPETNRTSWLDYGKATNWSFAGDLATYSTDYIILTYRVETAE